MANQSTRTGNAFLKMKATRDLPLMKDRSLIAGLGSGASAAEDQEREAAVNHLFDTFRKLKARIKNGRRSAEVFSSQDPSRTAPSSKTPAQIAFDRITSQDRVTLINAFSCSRDSR
jgi:hypothetical protein